MPGPGTTGPGNALDPRDWGFYSHDSAEPTESECGGERGTGHFQASLEACFLVQMERSLPHLERDDDSCPSPSPIYKEHFEGC